jgi:tRNA A37 threonylcarbamoyladenosine modification protein TsaB
MFVALIVFFSFFYTEIVFNPNEVADNLKKYGVKAVIYRDKLQEWAAFEVEQELEKQDLTWKDLSGLVVFKGPGSFTGLRIGITVMNSLAYANGLPIVGITGERWQQEGLQRLAAGENDTIVMPEYGGEANITKPRK